jgi:hypothetical protein
MALIFPKKKSSEKLDENNTMGRIDSQAGENNDVPGFASNNSGWGVNENGPFKNHQMKPPKKKHKAQQQSGDSSGDFQNQVIEIPYKRKPPKKKPPKSALTREVISDELPEDGFIESRRLEGDGIIEEKTDVDVDNDDSRSTIHKPNPVKPPEKRKGSSNAVPVEVPDEDKPVSVVDQDTNRDDSLIDGPELVTDPVPENNSEVLPIGNESIFNKGDIKTSIDSEPSASDDVINHEVNNDSDESDENSTTDSDNDIIINPTDEPQRDADGNIELYETEQDGIYEDTCGNPYDAEGNRLEYEDEDDSGDSDNEIITEYTKEPVTDADGNIELYETDIEGVYENSCGIPYDAEGNQLEYEGDDNRESEQSEQGASDGEVGDVRQLEPVNGEEIVSDIISTNEISDTTEFSSSVISAEFDDRINDDGPMASEPSILNSGNEDEGPDNRFRKFFSNIKQFVITAMALLIAPIETDPDRPTFNLQGLDITEINHECFRLLKKFNEKVLQFFVGPEGDIIQAMKDRQTTQLKMSQSSKSDLRYILARLARFVTINNDGEVKNKMLSYDIINDLRATQNKPLPQLNRICKHPFYSKNGMLIYTSGYHKKAKTILELPEKFPMYQINENPSDEEIVVAKDNIVKVLFRDFIFETESDQANAVALFLLFLGRDLVDGPTPMHIVESAEFGTGKTLLVESVVKVISGEAVEESTFPTSEAEVRRQLLAHLIKKPEYIFFDNLGDDYRLASAELAQMLTGTMKSGRILGQSKIVDIAINLIWVTSGVNMNISREILRRCIRIRLQKTDNYTHRDHLAYVLNNRAEIIWSGLTMIQAWIAKGCPIPAEKRLRSFDRWAGVFGGILEVAGIPGLLDNQDSFENSGDPEFDGYLALVSMWWKEFGNRKILSRNLIELINNEQLPIELEGRSDNKRATSLGYVLRRLKDRKFGDYIIKDAGLRSGRRQWRLTASK